jgi:hypothetical protein
MDDWTMVASGQRTYGRAMHSAHVSPAVIARALEEVTLVLDEEAVPATDQDGRLLTLTQRVVVLLARDGVEF